MSSSEEQDEVYNLDVPIIEQNDDYSCVPVSLEMVLDYLVQEGKIEMSEITLNKISRIVQADPADGTALGNVPLINDHLKKASKKVGFIPSERNTFENIREELANGRPVIAWKRDFPDRTLKHSVVVKGIDEENLYVIMNDPFFGETKETITSFQASWDRAANILIRVRIGSKLPQTEMVQYIEQ